MSDQRGFKFRLQTLLEHRQQLVEEAEQVLAQHQQTIAHHQQGLDFIAERRAQMNAYLGALQVQPSIDIQALQSVSGYDGVLNAEAKAITVRLRAAEQAAREASAVVVQRRIDLEVIEKLRERDLKRFTAEQRARADRVLDEFASAAFARNMGAARGLHPAGDTPWKDQDSTSRASHSS
ncbi:MAG: flagellar export protein FliJ [Thermomicrobiales bacterium]